MNIGVFLGNLWDIVGRRPSGSAILTPSLTSVPHQIGAGAWGKRSDAPSSPESHRSFMSSASARRGHRSQRSDALPGHYNTGKRRRQKQLLQMIALKVRCLGLKYLTTKIGGAFLILILLLKSFGEIY